MPFYPASWTPRLPFEPPDDVSIPEFMLDEKHGRCKLARSKPMFVCGLSGRHYENAETIERVDLLARGIAHEMGWQPNAGSEHSKVVGIFSLNGIDTIPVSWATHRLGGVASPANAAYSSLELQHQLKDSGAKCLFTNAQFLDKAVPAARQVGISQKHIYIIDLPDQVTGGKGAPNDFKSVDDLINLGRQCPKLEEMRFRKGDGASRTAFLCYSSGTSGFPKGVMISHRNVVANILQLVTFSNATSRKHPSSHVENALGLLPFSHIYGLVLISHFSIYQGDGVIVLPRFEMKSFLSTIQTHKITQLYVVPPIIIQMVKNRRLLGEYDLSSVRDILTGAAPLGQETAQTVLEMFPNWRVLQGYGLTETCTVVTWTSPDDIWLGSCGSVLPGYEIKLVSDEGVEITQHDQPGELWAKSPTIVQGYLHNEKANAETFVDGFMRTGDKAVIRKSPKGHEHIFIVDRIKELIKVKGLQVAPAELEAHLLTHEAVADCAVIAIPDDEAGEIPKAFVVRSANSGGIEDSPRLLMRQIAKHVEQHKARHKWLKGGIEFVDEIPKSPSGKILRRLLRDKEREKKKRQAGAKL